VLLARIRARTRTPPGENPAQMRFADLFVDSEKCEAVRGGQRLELAFTDFSILECLMRSAGRVVKRDRIIDFVWAGEEISDNNLNGNARSRGEAQKIGPGFGEGRSSDVIATLASVQATPGCLAVKKAANTRHCNSEAEP
jgi:hypothetical protein